MLWLTSQSATIARLRTSNNKKTSKLHIRQIEHIALLLQPPHNLRVRRQTLQPLAIVDVRHLAAVHLRQMGRRNVPMQRLHIAAMEVDLAQHALVQKRLEHPEHQIEHPAVVDHMDLVGALRRRRHNQPDHLLHDRRTAGPHVIQRVAGKVEDADAAHHLRHRLQGAELQQQQRGRHDVGDVDARRLPVAQLEENHAPLVLVLVRRHGDHIVGAQAEQAHRIEVAVQLRVGRPEVVVVAQLWRWKSGYGICGVLNSSRVREVDAISLR